jgi:hypothetical protein
VPKASASETVRLKDFEGHFEHLKGFSVAFERFTEDLDLAQSYEGADARWSTGATC